jgi:hypothetical protein
MERDSRAWQYVGNAKNYRRGRKGAQRGELGKDMEVAFHPITFAILRGPILHDVKLDLSASPSHSTPLVLGMSRMRGSGSTAIRSARAVALKIPSAMWWPLRP